MIEFRSKRERRLWGWALAVLAAIYTTVGLAGTWVRMLQQRDLLDGAFVLAFVAVVVAVVGIGLQRRPTVSEVWIGLGVAAVYGMVAVRMGVDPIERTHLFEYGLLAVLIFEALVERGGETRRLFRSAVAAVLVTALLGWGDEAIQALLPNRIYDIRDVGVNALAALGATSASVALAWIRGRRQSRPSSNRERRGGSGSAP